MPIMIAPVDTDLTIVRIVGNDKTCKHLRELGLVPNTIIRLLSHTESGIIVRVGETRLALDKNVARNIVVETN